MPKTSHQFFCFLRASSSLLLESSNYTTPKGRLVTPCPSLSQAVLRAYPELEELDPKEGDIGPRYWLGLGGGAGGKRPLDLVLSEKGTVLQHGRGIRPVDWRE